MNYHCMQRNGWMSLTNGLVKEGRYRRTHTTVSPYMCLHLCTGWGESRFTVVRVGIIQTLRNCDTRVNSVFHIRTAVNLLCPSLHVREKAKLPWQKLEQRLCLNVRGSGVVIDWKRCEKTLGFWNVLYLDVGGGYMVEYIWKFVKLYS